MPDYLLIGPLALGFVNAVTGFAGMQKFRHLEAQIGILRRVLLVQWIALLLQVALMGWHIGSSPRLPFGSETDAAALREHLRAVRDHDATGWFAVLGAVFLILIVLPCVIHVLRGLAPFVASHRVDLLARDQAATWPGEVEGGSGSAENAPSR